MIIKKNILVTVLCLLCSSLFAGNRQDVDSLLSVLLSAKEDTVIIKCLSNLSYNLRNTDPEKALQYAQQCLSLANKTGIKKWIGVGLTGMGIIKIGMSEYDEALKYVEKALAIRKELDDKEGIAANLNNLGIICKHSGDYSKALEYYNESLNLRKQLNDLRGTGACYMNIGTIYHLLCDYNQAMTYYRDALVISEKTGDKDGLSSGYNNMGYLLVDRQKYMEAIELFEKSMSIDIELGNKNGVSACANNIGNAYLFLKNYPLAIEYYNRALKIAGELNDKRATSMGYLNISCVYLSNGDFSQALPYLLRSLKLNEEINEVQTQPIILGNIGSAYCGLKRYDLAITYANKCLKASEETGSIDDQKTAYETLMQSYEGLNDFQNSVACAKMLLALSDTLYRNKSNEQMVRMEAMYQTEKKQKEIELLNKDKDLQSAKIKQQKFIIFGVIGVLIIVIFFSVLVFRLYRQKQKINRILEMQNQEILHKKEEIQMQAEQLAIVNSELSVKNRHITDSINYAKLIQVALLPGQETFNKVFPQSFIFFRPRNIVSGDFYWLYTTGEMTFIAVVDCTGHGVPGAFMSMIGMTLLNEIVKNKRVYKPAHILNELNSEIISALKQNEHAENAQQDGMDISLCCIDKTKRTIEMSCANHTILLYRGNRLSATEGDVFSIGGVLGKIVNKNFTEAIYDLDEPAHLYMFTDGYGDQFGGNDNKKFGITRLKNLFSEIHKVPMDEQYRQVQSAHDNWKGYRSQVDDVLVIGLEIL